MPFSKIAIDISIFLFKNLPKMLHKDLRIIKSLSDVQL